MYVHVRTYTYVPTLRMFLFILVLMMLLLMMLLMMLPMLLLMLLLTPLLVLPIMMLLILFFIFLALMATAMAMAACIKARTAKVAQHPQNVLARRYWHNTALVSSAGGRVADICLVQILASKASGPGATRMKDNNSGRGAGTLTLMMTTLTLMMTIMIMVTMMVAVMIMRALMTMAMLTQMMMMSVMMMMIVMMPWDAENKTGRYRLRHR